MLANYNASKLAPIFKLSSHTVLEINFRFLSNGTKLKINFRCLSIWTKCKFIWFKIQNENCHHNYIPFNLKGNRNLFYDSRLVDFSHAKKNTFLNTRTSQCNPSEIKKFQGSFKRKFHYPRQIICASKWIY